MSARQVKTCYELAPNPGGSLPYHHPGDNTGDSQERHRRLHRRQHRPPKGVAVGQVSDLPCYLLNSNAVAAGVDTATPVPDDCTSPLTA